MLDGFIRFYNDERSIFASDQKNAAYSNAIPVPNTSAADGGILDGYFTAPAEGSRIAGTTAIRARLSKELSAETADLKFVLSGINGQSIELSPTQEADKRTYTASLSKGKKYFAKKSGAVAKGQFMRTASGSKIYAKKSGALATNGLFTVKGAKYYAKKSGAIVTKKWVKVGNKLYYCSASGKITKTKKAR